MRVAAAERVTPDIKRFTLVCERGGELPAFSAGSHIEVTPDDDEAPAFRNAYSLVSPPHETQFYQIAVRRDDSARAKGGSRHLHEQIRPGAILRITPPKNRFPLVRHATKHLLIAGGIGITPFFSH